MFDRTALVVRTAAFSALVGLSSLANAAVTLVNPGFDNPILSPGAFQYAGEGGATINGWTFSGLVSGVSGSGIAANNSAFNLVNAPGGQAAFLQMNDASVSQAFTATDVGLYSVTFLAQGRNANAGAAPFSVSIGNQTLQFSAVTELTPALGSFTSYTSNAINLNPGVYTLTFRSGTTGSMDKTTFIDSVAVNVSPVPEPHEWAMMLAGLGLVGWAARRRQRDSAPVGFAAA